MSSVSYSEAQWAFLAFVFLGVVLGLAWLARRYIPGLAALFIPGSVIAGFVILLIGPQVLGALTGTGGLIPAAVIAVWSVLPGILINIVFAAVMLGKTLPSLREIWGLSAPHVIFGSVLSFGQFALGAFAVVLILTPFFGLTDLAGSILELSFAGGHGTIAGMGPLLEDAGAGEVVDLGLGLATVSMVTGVVGGSLILRFAIRSPRIRVAREHPPSSTEAMRITAHEAAGRREPESQPDIGMGPVTAAFMFIALAIAVAIVILELLRLIFGGLGIDVFEDFPLFPFTVIGGFIVQFVATRLGVDRFIDRRSVAGISSISLDALIASAIGTMSLAALGANVPTLVILTVIGVAWSVIGLLFIAPRIHTHHWFEHGLADFGQSQGNVATGFILAEMADPHDMSNTVTAYGYKQLTYEPLLGGGLITAFSIPLIIEIGSLAFGVASAIITVVLILWGVLRSRRVRAAA